MSKRGGVILSNIRHILLRRSNVRQFERCGLRLTPVTTTSFATLHFWPGHELQQHHRTFASSTTSDDDESTRKTTDKHKKQPATATGRKNKERIATKKECEGDNESERCAVYRRQAIVFANRVKTFKMKRANKKNLAVKTAEFRKRREHAKKKQERLAQEKLQAKDLEQHEIKANLDCELDGSCEENADHSRKHKKPTRLAMRFLRLKKLMKFKSSEDTSVSDNKSDETKLKSKESESRERDD